jgi:primosomal protein N' (replication factor Y) (superfamily II helicase)
VTEAEQLALGGTPKPRRRAPRPAQPIVTDRPVARVLVDTGVPHLDRPFDYAVPEKLAGAEAGCRVRVRFSGRLVDGFVLERRDDTDHEGRLAPLSALVGTEPVLVPEVAALARALADRSAGTAYDVVRLAVPPRHAQVEAEPHDPAPSAAVARPEPGTWSRYPQGSAFLDALLDGSPRAVWSALPGPTWPSEVAAAVATTASAGRGALVVLPDHRDVERVGAALGELPHVVLRADLGPAERYRRWLRVRRGDVQVVVGTRATAYAPVRDLGLLVLWDDGDDLHEEPRAPYCHVRDVLVQRAHLQGAAALLGGLARSAEAQLLVDSGWAGELVADRATVRSAAPRVEGTDDRDQAADPAAKAARLPHTAFVAARESLARDEPVLVQVPRRGYLPSLACVRDRTPARCPGCRGPLQLSSGHAVPGCAWCGRVAGDWRCPQCEGRQVRASVVGARRTAEELGRAFPGAVVVTSGRDGVQATVPARPALVVSTPGAEPVATGGYGAVLLLDGWALLTRADLDAGEETLRRWLNAAALARPAADGGRVVVVADQALTTVQSLVRWDPAGAASRELAERTELGFPPATRMAAVSGPPQAVAGVLAEVARALEVEVLGPVPTEGGERAFLRVARREGPALAQALREVLAVRSARKDPAVRVQLDPRSLV